MSSAYAINTCCLKKTFAVKDKTRQVEAVKNVTLSVRKGEIFGLLGPNGAGKTTCQRMLTTLLPIDSGSASIAGYDVKRQPNEVRRHIGYVSQSGGADLPATGRENLMLAGRLYSMRHDDVKKRVTELSRLLEIDQLLERVVRHYSGGQKRRLEVALSLIHQPDILFLDEPTTGLDPQNRASLWIYIKKLKETGKTIFLTTHYLEEADELADCLAIMDQGEIVAQGSPQMLKRQISGDVISIQLREKHLLPEYFLIGLDFIKEYREEGLIVFLYVDDGPRALPMLFERLKDKQIKIKEISLSSPTLNDVFLKKTGRLLRDTGKEVIV